MFCFVPIKSTNFIRNMYTEKYAHFQSSLKKSNDVFETYKIEMSKVRCSFVIVKKIFSDRHLLNNYDPESTFSLDGQEN